MAEKKTYDLDELNEYFQIPTVLPPDPVEEEEEDDG